MDRDIKKYTLVIGDLMLDEYIFGNVERVSPESCCPILHEAKRAQQLGGAANVALQIRKLGGNVKIAGVIGDDVFGKQLLDMLKSEDIDTSLVFPHPCRTALKRRYVNQLHQQMFRVDAEDVMELGTAEKHAILETIKDDCDIVISDYNKGTVAKEFCQAVIATARKYGQNVVVDIKVSDIDKYQGASIVKGNRREITNLLADGLQDFPVEVGLQMLRAKLDTKLLVMTCGSEGLVAVDEDRFYRFPAEQRMVFDVTGAGDVVTAYCSVLNTQGNDYEHILRYANKASNIKVGHFGNSCVLLDEVMGRAMKVVDVNHVQSAGKEKKIVFTNGCFDVIHAGHIDLLQKAKALGDVLVVGLNSDESVRRLKGNGRPVNKLEERVRVLSSIEAVDYIIVFEEDTPIRLIEELHPQVLVKGGDYAVADIKGADIVEKNGGKVFSIPFVYHTSTTQILKGGGQ